MHVVFEPHARIREVDGVFQHLAEHHRHVTRRGKPFSRGKPRAIDEIGVRHAQLLRPCVHAGDKTFHAPRHPLCERYAAVVGACHYDGLDEVPRPVLGARVEKYLRAAHRRGALRDHYLLVKREFSPVHGFEGEQHGHDLDHAGDGQTFVLVVGVKHGARRSVHQKGGASFHREFLGVRRVGCEHRRHHRAKHEQRHRSDYRRAFCEILYAIFHDTPRR